MAATSAHVNFDMPCCSPRGTDPGCVFDLCASPLGLRSGCVREPLRSPRAVHSGLVCRPLRSPRACRPRATISAMFAAWVPQRRCAGFWHGGLSHECRACASSKGGGPCANSHANRWAKVVRPVALNRPYPLLMRPAVHGQQAFGPPDMSTLAQKRSTVPSIATFQSWW